MTTRSQKRKATTEVASGQLEASFVETNQVENCVASTSKSPRIQTENLDEIKTCLKREIRADLTKILGKNQKQMLELITPAVRKPNAVQNLDNSDSETETLLPNPTSFPIKTKATTSKNTPVNCRNTYHGVLIVSGKSIFLDLHIRHPH